MQKSVKAKSARKPLMDISNSWKNTTKDPSAKKLAEKQHQQDQEEEIPNKYPNIISDEIKKALSIDDSSLILTSPISSARFRS
ncbi:hypothetical protein MRB53_006631 [Persea americana]|uniref:Uncharacterized protein n=1 Tax=Persea americana TaxID=3435 RepID=A0ACC2MH76_PERAE|nr:hypothetical protein MRB53_006631 [Persea americana]